jgi:MFS family permease
MADQQTAAQAARATLPKDRLGKNYFKLFGASTISNLGDGIGVIAYPWLASALTRNALLIALVAVVQRLPWLLFSLPAGVLTDRKDRRSLMVMASVVRAVLTLGVAFVVVAQTSELPGVDILNDPEAQLPTNVVLYILVLFATLLLGTAEVLYDNSAQTFMPTIVHTDQLEKANGRLWSTEMVANTFVGPPLGAVLIAAAFALPFFVDAATFAVSAVLISLVPRTAPQVPTGSEVKPSWRSELVEGIRWLWNHELLRPLAIILGLLNALGALTGAVLILFAQEVLETSATEFAILTTGGAIGGLVGGWTASNISRRIGSGPSLYLTLLGGAVTNIAIGLSSSWMFAWVMFAFSTLTAVLWNVITVSLRQTIIPDHLLGRVNSVYRFFAWGMMPIGSVTGGLIVLIADATVSREWALRLPALIGGALHIVLFVFAAPKLTSAKIAAARAAVAEPDTV